MVKKLTIGVLGAGHLGKIHIKCILESDAFELVGFYDANAETATQVAQSFNIKSFDSIDDLLAACTVVDIVTPTIFHYALAAKAAKMGKHIFIEKPLTHTLKEAQSLLKIVEKTGVKVQVGHVERFNPAFLALGEMSLAPMFVEAHRLAQFNPRGTDVSVVLDLMIHDIDLILHCVKSEVKNIHASGVSVVSETPDIANARIEFKNGCVANITASRLSLKQMRKVRFFQPDAYISLDFLEKNAQIIRLYDENSRPTEGGNFFELPTPKGTKYIDVNMPESQQVNAIKMELEAFATSILNDTPIKVTIEDGFKALKVAHRIIKAIGDTTLS
jgi:predicted dehydrogenase